MSTKYRFDEEKHRKTGRELKAVRAELFLLAREIDMLYPKGGKEINAINRVINAIERLRSVLEDSMLSDFPETTDVNVYYGKPPVNVYYSEPNGDEAA